MSNLVWFRNDLRVSDNKTLTEACKGDKVVAVYIFDPYFYKEGDFGFKKTERYRAQFILESVKELKNNLADLNISLLVYHDNPKDIIPKLIEEHGIKNLYLQKEWTRDERKQLEHAKEKLSGVKIHEYYDQFLFHPKDLPYEDFSQIPKVYTAFRKKCEKEVSVRDSLPTPKKKSDANRINHDTTILSLADLGLDQIEKDERTAFPFTGGERSALDRLQHYFWETKNLAQYKQTRNGLVGTDYSSKFSAWLANGSISARTIYHKVKKFEKEVKKNQDTYWMIFELIWRDFFKYVSLKHGDNIFHLGGILDKEYNWQNDIETLDAWKNGETEYDFVNANMIELAKTGFMSNRGRQNVASYFAKEKEQDWRIGAAYFESLLVDYDVHSNWGNWMYNAGVGNDPRDRKFNIKSQADRYDGDRSYRDLWLNA
ncbi:DASH family cryptochrome [Gangjinia marincola]|uniref:Cryptochrome DASH n=1 Tax=Gangjinia marincola TaxID=578463 RepID=A0ABN1MJC1_9FLAO